VIECLVDVIHGRISGKTAADAHTLAEMSGGTYTARFTTPRGRSLSQLNLFWAMCGLIAENLDADPPVTKDQVAWVLKVEAGHANPVRFMDGTYRMFPRSIAFNAMSQEAFSGVMDRMFTAAAIKFGPALAHAARAELAKMMEGKRS